MLLSKASGLLFCSLGTILLYQNQIQIPLTKSTNFSTGFCAYFQTAFFF